MSPARYFKFWLPVVIWMVVIFSASTNLGATKNTSRIIGPALRWMFPEISDEAVSTVQFVIRKTCHAVEYAILALLLWRAKRNTDSTAPSGWNKKHAKFAIVIAVIYAATDEFHQFFVASRQGSIWDVLLDTAGAVAGISVLWCAGRWMKRW